MSDNSDIIPIGTLIQQESNPDIIPIYQMIQNEAQNNQPSVGSEMMKGAMTSPVDAGMTLGAKIVGAKPPMPMPSGVIGNSGMAPLAAANAGGQVLKRMAQPIVQPQINKVPTQPLLPQPKINDLSSLAQIANPSVAALLQTVSPRFAVQQMSDLATNPTALAMSMPETKVGEGVANAAEGAINSSSKALNGVTETAGNLAKPLEFAKSVRSSMFGLRKQLGETLDSKISQLSETNPEKTIDLTDHFNTIKDAIKDAENNPGLASDIQRTLKGVKDPEIAAKIKSLIRNPDNAAELSLRDAEDIKRAISNSPVIANKARMGKFANWTVGDHELLDLADNIKSSQSEVFPELSDVRKPYADYMQNYNKVKNAFKEGRLLGKMRGKFGDEEIQQAAQKVLPPDVWKQVQNFGTANKVAGAVKKGAMGIGALDFLYRIFKH